MFTFKTISELGAAQLLVGDVVMVMGNSSVGDSPVRFGLVYPNNHTSSNTLITIANGFKVELNPT